jgi:hypothetical protein
MALATEGGQKTAHGQMASNQPSDTKRGFRCFICYTGDGGNNMLHINSQWR